MKEFVLTWENMENTGRCKAKQLYLCLQRKVWLRNE